MYLEILIATGLNDVCTTGLLVNGKMMDSSLFVEEFRDETVNVK